MEKEGTWRGNKEEKNFTFGLIGLVTYYILFLVAYKPHLLIHLKDLDIFNIQQLTFYLKEK